MYIDTYIYIYKYTYANCTKHPPIQLLYTNIKILKQEIRMLATKFANTKVWKTHSC
jgi:hypothetical protein